MAVDTILRKLVPFGVCSGVRLVVVNLYAAYASNLSPHHMADRAPCSPSQGTGWLRGWRLTFGGEARGFDGALATIVEDPDHMTYVALYEISAVDQRILDEIEGAPYGVYQKITVRVETLEGDQKAWAYVLDDYEGGLPSAHYLNMIADAAEAANAPEDYVIGLRERPCRSLED